MFPNFAKDNAGDDRLSHPVFVGKRILRYAASVVSVADFLRLYLGETCHVVCAASPQRIWASTRHVAITFGVITSASRFAVIGIVSLCPKSKMQRITATGVIAIMKHVRTVSNWSICKFICQPVSDISTALVVHFAIAKTVTAASKQPTCIETGGSINADPKITRSGLARHMMNFLSSKSFSIIHESAVSTR